MKLPLVPFLGLAAGLIGCSSAPKDPTLCELAANRSAFAGRTITVEGTLLVSKHGNAVEDEACGKGIPVSWEGSDQNLRELSAVVAHRAPVQRGTAKVRVTGQMRQVSKSAFLNEPYWELRLSSAQMLR